MKRMMNSIFALVLAVSSVPVCMMQAAAEEATNADYVMTAAEQLGDYSYEELLAMTKEELYAISPEVSHVVGDIAQYYLGGPAPASGVVPLQADVSAVKLPQIGEAEFVAKELNIPQKNVFSVSAYAQGDGDYQIYNLNLIASEEAATEDAQFHEMICLALSTVYTQENVRLSSQMNVMTGDSDPRQAEDFPLILRFSLYGKTEQAVLYGDYTNDGAFDITDVVAFNRMILFDLPVGDIQFAQFDVNKDGALDQADCMILMQYLVQIEKKLPVR